MIKVANKNFYLIKDLEKDLKLSAMTIRTYCKKKVFPTSFKKGKIWYIPETDVLNYFTN